MKNQVELIIVLTFGFSFLMYLFPFIFVEATKLESGVTINAPPTNEICNNGIDDDGNGATDEDCAAAPTGPAAGTCELQIVSGVPINYGQILNPLNWGQDEKEGISAVQKVTIKNVGTAKANIMIKFGNWISDAAGNPIRDGPDLTRVHVGFYSGSILGPSSNFNVGYSGEILGGQSIPVWFELMKPRWSPGSYHQEVSIELHC